MPSASKTYERRGAERVRADLSASWHGSLAHHKGTVTDISVSGCFILTPDEVSDGETVRVEMRAPGGRRVTQPGQVVYRVPEMGFAVRFVASSPAESAALQYLFLELKARQILNRK
jgi:PilZ domain